MNSNNPALNQKEYERKIDAIKVCGANRGPHNYIPVSWLKTETSEHVTHFMCTVCFTRINSQLLYQHFEEIRI